MKFKKVAETTEWPKKFKSIRNDRTGLRAVIFVAS